MAAHQIMLVNHSSMSVSPAELTAVAAALQTQVTRDFVPAWGIPATVTALTQGHPPAGAWQLRILDHVTGGLGIHLDHHGHPYAQILAGNDWTITASHELLEMLEDPLGHKFIQAPDIDPASDGHLVSYLVEVCDPCEVFSYTIDGIAVSDFVTRDYYDENATGVALDFLQKLPKPYTVPEGCYISWEDPEDHRWHQKRPDGSFVTAMEKINRRRNPRADRDAAFGSDEDNGQHNLAPILADYADK